MGRRKKHDKFNESGTIPRAGAGIHDQPGGVLHRRSIHIYWYGVCIAVGLCLALVFAFRHCQEFGVDPDAMVDVILIGVVLGIASARAYYVAMAPF